ncbi:MAG TPA: hypothetical protein DD706_23455 [Nitrospiraceae bacterium]|nr:hypothetical protein [Nitrospiraceae bacterium]
MWVCSACATARQIHESDLEVGAIMKGMPDYVKAVPESDHNLRFKSLVGRTQTARRPWGY